MDPLTSPRVAFLLRRPGCHRESAKTDEADLVAAFQRLGDRIQYRVYGLARFRFPQVSLAADGVVEFISVHGYPAGRVCGNKSARSPGVSSAASSRSTPHPPKTEGILGH